LKAAFSKDDKDESVIDMLLEKASLQGHVTLEDLEEIIPRSGTCVEKIEEMVGILNRQGVQVVFPEEEEVLSASGFSQEDEEEGDQETDQVVVAGVEKVASDDTITLYLREMSKVPLLKKEQEVSLAKRYEAGRAAKEELIRLGNNNTPEKRKLLEELPKMDCWHGST